MTPLNEFYSNRRTKHLSYSLLKVNQNTEPSLKQDTKKTKNTWYLYVVQCRDQSLYAGITTDLERRIIEHNESKKGARYTRSRRPVTLVISWIYNDRSQASKAEYAFKRLSTSKKKEKISGNIPPL